MTSPDELQTELKGLELVARYYDRVRLAMHLQMVEQRIAQIRAALGQGRVDATASGPSPPLPPGTEQVEVADGCG